MSAHALLLIMPIATDQSSLLLWLRPVATDFLKEQKFRIH
jgi:hypothetical protein